ncbi:MAG: stage II sporulation protein M [Anaerolineales bacterium]|jgi:uncharacterized membrane protein SpoIIM required for sporulation
MMLSRIVKAVGTALIRARVPILTFAATYLVAVLVGAAMVHAGSTFALETRDATVARAQSSSILKAYHEGSRFEAALLDFGGNLLSASANTISGLTIVVPYPIAAFRGWIVGIVSVDSHHASRLSDPKDAVYYILTVLLQLIPHSLAGGAGVNLGLAYINPPPHYAGDLWLRLPKEALRDTLRIYAIVVPLFLVASLWEFLAA